MASRYNRNKKYRAENNTLLWQLDIIETRDREQILDFSCQLIIIKTRNIEPETGLFMSTYYNRTMKYRPETRLVMENR